MKRAYTFAEMDAMGIDEALYSLMDKEGVFKANLDFKRWGNKRNIIAYFTFDDGSKIVSSAWKNCSYLGIPEIPLNSYVELTYEKAKNGVCYLRKADVLVESDEE